MTEALQPARPVPGAPHGLLRVHLTRYAGRPITLPDGTRIERGALVAELHFNNQLVSAAAQEAGPFELTRMIADDMGALARWATEPGGAMARAVIGVTLLGRAAPRLGFTPRERPVTLHARLERFFMQGLLAIYNPQGVSRLAVGATYAGYPVEIWMSRAALLRRYSPGLTPTPLPLGEGRQVGEE
jgi:hypothetical protein